MIEATDIHKSFSRLEVLRGISLQLRSGRITAFLGPSGAGKTTLLQILGTLMPPDSGHVRYDGEDVTRLSDKKLSAFRNRHIGFVFQFHRLLPEFSAQENVMLPALIGGAPRAAARSRANELLDMLGLADRLRHKPAQLSGGECQRVAVARALVNSPSVVFADEPTGSLDPANRDEIRALFRRLCDELGHTFVIVTHDLSLASVASRVVRMDGGLVTSDTDTANQPASPGVIQIAAQPGAPDSASAPEYPPTHTSYIMEGKRQAKIARLLQKELSEIFRRQTAAMGNVLVSVSAVKVSPDLSIARAYLSIFPPEKARDILANITRQTKTVRYELAGRVKMILRKCPDLQFYLDDSLDYIENIDRLLAADKKPESD